jgi:hypothetical protein
MSPNESHHHLRRHLRLAVRHAAKLVQNPGLRGPVLAHFAEVYTLLKTIKEAEDRLVPAVQEQAAGHIK